MKILRVERRYNIAILIFLALVIVIIQALPKLKIVINKISAGEKYPAGTNDLNQDVREFHENQ